MRIPNLDSGNPVSFSNLNGVTFGIAGDTITASVAAGAGVGGIAVNAATTYTSGTVVFSNANGVTFGTNAQTVTASVAAVSAISGIGVNGGAATTNGTVVFSNSNNVTFGGNGSTITASASASPPTLSYWQNMGAGPMAQASTFNTFSVIPMFDGIEGFFPGKMTANTFLIGVNGAASQSTASGSMMFLFGIYTWNASTLSLLNSASTQITYAAVSNNSTAFSGQRWLSIHSSVWSAQPTFSQTQYWLGYIVSSSNATQSMSLLGQGYLNAIGRYGTVGSNQSQSQGSYGWAPFMGAYTVTTAALPTSVNQSDLNAAATSVGNFVPHVAFNNIGAF